MVRRVAILIGALTSVITCVPTPWATADDPQSVRTESGRVRCYVYTNDVSQRGGPLVVCSTTSQDPTGFPQAPLSSTPGYHFNLAMVRANGAFNWDIGNIPGSPEATAKDMVLNYGQTYRINGWSILPNFDGTTFTNDGTGHGMFVSIDNVNSF
jgi:hypothetical protein